MANYGLINNLSALPLHSTNQYDSELIVVDNNAGRPITARASYITNLSDLTITLAAGNLDVGAFHIQDPGPSDLKANVVPVGIGQGALRVLTQDLDSVHDSISIGDINGNFAYVTNSALNVFTTNGISAVSVTNFPNQLTAVSVTNQLTGITVLNPITAVGIKQTVTNWDVLSAAVNGSTYTTFPSNPANEITILNNTGGIIYIKNAAKTIGLPIDNNTSFDIKLVGDTNEVAVKASSNNKTVYATFIAYN